MRPKTLIIGYGNLLRRDDGLGEFVISRLRERVSNEIVFKTYHQVDVSQAEEIQEFDRVVFIDSHSGIYSEDVHIEDILPGADIPSYTTHLSSPPSLLSLVEALYHKKIKASHVAVRGYDFSYGRGCSPEAEQKAQQAVIKILEMLKLG